LFILSLQKIRDKGKNGFYLEARVWGGREEVGGKGGRWGSGGEMTQTLYVHMNKWKKKSFLYYLTLHS
jgi:hypothetical protein